MRGTRGYWDAASPRHWGAEHASPLRTVAYQIIIFTMKATRITATELARSLSDVLNRVKYQGERFVVERGGEPVAEISGPPRTKAVTLHDLVSRLSDLPPADEDFAGDLARIRAGQGEARNPWPS